MLTRPLVASAALCVACGSDSNSPSGTSSGTHTSSTTSTANGGAPSTNTGIDTGAGASTATTTATTTQTSQGDSNVILYGSAYTNVNMWLGPVDYAETQWHNACGLSDGSKYPAIIQQLYGNYLIGLDGGNLPNVATHCDNCAQLTANGKTIIAHIVTYGEENGTFALDLSPEARAALGLSDSNWTGTWQFCSCPTNGKPIYYEFDGGQWSPQNFWYMRIWIRNQRLPVTKLETKLGSGNWTPASQVDDGAWESQSGVDYSGGFQVRVTAVDNQQLVDSIPAPTSLDPANPVAGKSNFQ